MQEQEAGIPRRPRSRSVSPRGKRPSAPTAQPAQQTGQTAWRPRSRSEHNVTRRRRPLADEQPDDLFSPATLPADATDRRVSVDATPVMHQRPMVGDDLCRRIRYRIDAPLTDHRRDGIVLADSGTGWRLRQREQNTDTPGFSTLADVGRSHRTQLAIARPPAPPCQDRQRLARCPAGLHPATQDRDAGRRSQHALFPQRQPLTVDVDLTVPFLTLFLGHPRLLPSAAATPSPGSPHGRPTCCAWWLPVTPTRRSPGGLAYPLQPWAPTWKHLHPAERLQPDRRRHPRVPRPGSPLTPTPQARHRSRPAKKPKLSHRRRGRRARRAPARRALHPAAARC